MRVTHRAPLLVLIGAAACGGGGATPTVRGTGPSPDVAVVIVTPSTLTLDPGALATLRAEPRDARGAPLSGVTVAWRSSDPAVASVGASGIEGDVAALAPGSTTITATAGGREGRATITVKATYDLDRLGVPRAVTSNYLDPSVLLRVSRFRSGFGHDYSDAAESCRSMKHYFQPRSDVDWGGVVIRAPFDAYVGELLGETTFGTQLRLRSTAVPALTAVLFHVRPDSALAVGRVVRSGERLGTHIGSQTLSDLALRLETPSGSRLVSYFEALDETLLAAWTARGVTSRASMVIARGERDASPLRCTGEQFDDAGTLENWVWLH